MKGARTENRGTVASRYSFILLPVQKNEESNSLKRKQEKTRGKKYLLRWGMPGMCSFRRLANS